MASPRCIAVGNTAVPAPRGSSASRAEAAASVVVAEGSQTGWGSY